MIISKENEEMRYEQSREYNEKLVQYRCKKCGKMFSKLKLSALNCVCDRCNSPAFTIIYSKEEMIKEDLILEG